MDIHTSALGASEAPSRTDSVQHGTEHTAPYARPSLDVFIICGPSGVGKGTIIDHLLRTYPDTFGFSISHTTRAPRPGEIDGVHYHFVHESQMRCEIDQGNFLEFAIVHGRMYGTSKQAVLHVIESLRRICILDIDLQGLRRLYDQRESLPFTFKVLFVRPPNIDTLQTRLERRGSESREDISVRMETAEQEMRVITENPELFDSVIENCELSHCISDIVNTLRSWGAHGI